MYTSKTKENKYPRTRKSDMTTNIDRSSWVPRPIIRNGWNFFEEEMRKKVSSATPDEWEMIQKTYFLRPDKEYLVEAAKGKNIDLILKFISQGVSISTSSLIFITLYDCLTPLLDILLPVVKKNKWVTLIRKCVDYILPHEYRKINDYHNIEDDVLLDIVSSGRVDLVEILSEKRELYTLLEVSMESASENTINFILSLSGVFVSKDQKICFDIAKRKDYVQASDYIRRHPDSVEARYLFLSLPGSPSKSYPEFMLDHIDITRFRNQMKLYMFLTSRIGKQEYDEYFILHSVKLDKYDKLILSLLNYHYIH